MFKTLPPIKAGFVGFGEINTPREFINQRCEDAATLLEDAGIKLIKTPPVSDDSEGRDATRALQELQTGEEFDLVIICIAGWIPSWAVFKVIEAFKHKPMVLWGLSGWQEGDKFITTADQAGTTALRFPMQALGYNFKYIVNYRNQAPRVEEIINYARAAQAVRLLKNAKLGMAGYRDMQLYGTMYDGLGVKKKFGVDIEHFELLELAQLMEKVEDSDIAKIVEEVNENWDFTKDPQSGTVENSVKLYLALHKKIEERGYEVLSYNDVDGIKKLMGFAPAGAMTLLHDKMNISSVPENDSLGMIMQMIVRSLTGQVGAYLEFYEFMKNGALMGVPDYVPSEIVEGRTTIMPNAFGDFGEGLLNVSKLKTGTVTLARLACIDDEYIMHIALAEAQTPIKWEEAGWTPPAPQLPSLEMIFETPIEDFIQKVMCQHYIISYGDNRMLLKEFASILNIKVI